MIILLYNPSTPDLYPRSVDDFRAAFPGLAVGDNPRDEEVAEFGWRVVAPSAPPTPGPGQQVVEAPPVEINGQWQQVWQLVDVPPPPPVVDWDNFVAWLYQFPPIARGMDAARRSTDPQGEPATTGLATALDEARLRRSYQPFALAWGLFLLASQMPPEAIGSIVAKASECNLPTGFITALQPSATP